MSTEYAFRHWRPDLDVFASVLGLCPICHDFVHGLEAHTYIKDTAWWVAHKDCVTGGES